MVKADGARRQASDGAAGDDGDEDALAAAARLPRPMVFTNGVFDVLHAGHVECLEQARALGRSLVVGVNSDASVQRLGKGPDRPINGQRDRARLIGALRPVSAVLVFDGDTPVELIRWLRPDVYVKGGDYTLADLPEAPVVASWGGHTVIVPRVPGLSSSAVIERIAALPPQMSRTPQTPQMSQPTKAENRPEQTSAQAPMQAPTQAPMQAPAPMQAQLQERTA